MTNNISYGNLYIVPTPIGNYNDITQRALAILNKVDFILSEDTRKTGILLKYFNINNKLYSYYEFNEYKQTINVIKSLQNGKNIALVSDAGTPLINDPGYRIVQLCRTKFNNTIKIIPLGGPCAAILALSASGLPTNRFCYEGFLSKKKNKRIKRLQELKFEYRTLIIYESKHRILNCLYDIKNIFGENRYIVIAKDLTKKWENIHGDTVFNLINWINLDKNRLKGEIVLIVQGYNQTVIINNNDKIIKILYELKKELSTKTAIKIVSQIYKIKKNILYKLIISKNID
ncbi:16S rRNA (cytidine(1402)-2'-O)-methyltransferase [Enterobacteriaceae endosymbiont of Neohaemonia nigricornis]|uniref:16S rRNA (cytidine(1402)-2'-O)-methyltransferase n=1 Tax=Enterobacteriaceae endosymbiont of Neohaemonia nigricornis TaxID=2675792 RepID=UPI001449EC79|nr:16S rRNA (cytidine(1402)-2'-O)-methyltransferase [Enterobacteriaceae endosymbiont of Neohaemonia nigricornis]QJC30225.1 16S rRNA (cytidine(1402)-2'-O)-methyltransferase [Enterobacteriaceae endosymbiont of Neohaemonia nigricornis]